LRIQIGIKNKEESVMKSEMIDETPTVVYGTSLRKTANDVRHRSSQWKNTVPEKQVFMRKMLVAILALGVGCIFPVCAVKGDDAPATNASATQSSKEGPPADVQQAIDQAMTKYSKGTSARYKALEATMGDWVKASPLAAHEWAAKQPNDIGQRHDLSITVVTLWARNDFPGLSDYLLHLPNNQGYGTLAGVWIGVDPAAACAWATKLSKDKWPIVMSAIGECWGRSDPVAASAWIEKLPTEQGSYGYGWVAVTWGWKDPHGAAAWVEKLPEGDARADAVGRLAGVWLRRLPMEQDKIKEWVRQMPIPEVRKTEILNQLEPKK
jgi:hypothetical protein